MRISDWSSDVCSSDLDGGSVVLRRAQFEKTLQLAQAMRNRHVAVNLEPDTAPVAHPLAVFVLPILVVAEHQRIDRRLSQPVAPFRFPGDQADHLAIGAQRPAGEVGAEASAIMTRAIGIEDGNTTRREKR